MNIKTNETDKVEKCRKWLLTCNNPQDHGWTLEKIVDILQKWKGVKYWCIGQEVGPNEKTPHIHFFIYSPNQILWSTVDNKFHGIHRDPCNGTILESRAYVFKIDKWEDTEKGTLHDYDSNQESGEPPEEKGSGFRTDLKGLFDLVESGKTTYEIIKENPDYINYLERIDKIRYVINEEKYGDKDTPKSVEYIWGDTGTGKTRGVYEEHGYRDVFRVTDYEHPFDGYRGQPVIVFEEFRSNLRIDDMLKYLDRYPIEIPARYANKFACYEKVYILTNIDIREQYPNIQREQPTTWRAFLRRINKIKVYTGNGIDEYETNDYMKNEFRYTFGLSTPFDENGGE